jgi:CheY-like chemotaxis protein
MPNVSGIKMCRLLQMDERYKKIPVIFLSAANDDYLALSALDAGGFKYLSKPIQISMLFDMVKSAVSE